MTRQHSEQPGHVDEVTSVRAAVRDAVIEAMTSQFARTEPSGRDAFWTDVTPGWPRRAKK